MALIMSDRIAVFNEGSVYQLDTPGELYEHPKNSFVAQFIGENNQIGGNVVSIEQGFCEVQLDGGGVMKALPINIDGVGSRTVLSVRPERIILNPEWPSLVFYRPRSTYARGHLCPGRSLRASFRSPFFNGRIHLL